MARSAAAGHVPRPLGRGRRQLPSPARRLDRSSRGERLLRGAARGALRARRRRGPCVLRRRPGRVGSTVAVRGHLGDSKTVSAPPAPPLLLASTSPQRRAILAQLGIPFDVVAPRYEEEVAPGGTSLAELVREHAAGKARSVAGGAGERPVLGVDTVVHLGGRIFGKPA